MVAAAPVALAVDEEPVAVVAALVIAAQVAYSLLSAFFNVTSNGPYNSPFCVWSLSLVSWSDGSVTAVSE